MEGSHSVFLMKAYNTIIKQTLSAIHQMNHYLLQEHTTQGYDQSSLLTVTIFWYGELKWIIKEVERIHSFTSLKRKGGTWEEKEGNWGEKERIEDISKNSRHLYLYSHCLYFYTCWIEGNRMELGWNIHRREHLQGRHKWLI